MARTEIVGLEEIVGANLLGKTVKGIKKVAGLPLDIAEYALRRTPVPSKSWFIGARTEIVGDGENCGLSEEELVLAREGGASERAAANRRLSSSGYNGHWKFSRPSSTSMGGRRQRHFARKLARNPQLLSQVQQRAQQGDQRAQRALAAYQNLQTTQPQYGSSQNQYSSQAPYASPWGAAQTQYPQATASTSYPTANVYYPSSSSSYADQSEYDDYSGDDDFQAKQTAAFAALGAIIKPAIASKRMSRVELAKAAAISAGPRASDDKVVSAAKEQIRSFLIRQGVKVE